jgi:hypothetical protein
MIRRRSTLATSAFSCRDRSRDKNLIRPIIFGIWMIALAVTASGQNVAPESGQKGSDQARLDKAMESIRENLSSVGKVTYAHYWHDQSNGQNWNAGATSVEISRVTADASTCSIQYHSFISVGRSSKVQASLSSTIPSH